VPGSVRVAVVVALAIGGVACTVGSSTPLGATTGTATAGNATDGSGQPGVQAQYPGELGELCVVEEHCAERTCVSLAHFIDADDGIDPDSGAGDPIDPTEDPTEDPTWDPTSDPQDPYGDGADEVGFCSRACATLFECPEDGWVCDLDLGACVPQILADWF
jgi:hypothetical protein